MGLVSRIGRAVLELSTDSASYKAGIAEAKADVKSLGQAWASVGGDMRVISRQVASYAQDFGGTRFLSQAHSMAQAVQQVGGVTKLTTDQKARLNHTMAEAIEKYRALGLQAPKVMVDLAQATTRVEQPLTLATKAAGLLKSTFAQFTAANLAASAIQTVTARVSEFIAVGVKLPSVEGSFQRLTKGVRQNSSEMLRTMQVATRGLVADYDLMLGANKAVLLGLPVTTKSMGELAQTATVLGRAMGLDTTTALDNLITALGRSSPLILDNLGLTVKESEAHEAFAAKLGKTASQLTEAEKKMAFYEAAMEAARQKTQQLGEQTKTLGEITVSVWTSIGNVISRAAAEINVGIGYVLGSAEKLGQFYTDVQNYGIATAVALARTRAEAERLANAQRTGNIELKSQAKATGDYVTALAQARAELARLSPEQRKQIAAAQQLGVDTAELEKKYDLSVGVLKLLTAETKDYTTAAKASAKAVTEAAEAQRGFTNFIEERRIEDAAAQMKATEEAAAEMRRLTNDIELRRIEDHKAANDERLKSDEDARKLQNEIGIGIMNAEAERIQQLQELRTRMWREVSRQLDQITMDVDTALADMLVRARGFKDGFLDIWRGIQRGIANILADILDNTFGKFLRDLLGKAAGAAFGKGASGLLGAGANAAIGAGAGAALGGGAAAMTVDTLPGAAAAGGGGGAAGGFLANPAFWTNPWTIGVAAGAAALTWAITKKGLFRGGWEGIEGNKRRDLYFGQFVERFGGTPYAAIVKAYTKAKVSGDIADRQIRALYDAHGKKAWERAEGASVNTLAAGGVRAKMFNAGTPGLDFANFGRRTPAELHGHEAVIPQGRGHQLAAEIANALRVRLTVPQLSMPIVGSRTVATSVFAPRTEAVQQRPVIHHHSHQWNISTLDADSFDDVLDKKIIPKFKSRLFFNEGGLATAVAGAAGRRR